MIKAASLLTPLPHDGEEIGRIAFLSGKQYWHQTLFCYFSLQIQCPERIVPVVFDDGTTGDETRSSISRVAPWTEFVEKEIIAETLDRLLPERRFPSLRARRGVYPHLRKLTDIHVGARGWTLVMDSDMLFFRRPKAVIEWFRQPSALFMQDIRSMYGYTKDLMDRLSRGPLPSSVNVGLYALNSASIDWDHLEYACRTQIEREGPHYLQEQALTALLLAGCDARPLSRQDYVVMPSLSEGRNPKAVLHHYVAHSKRSYYQHGWRTIASLQNCV